MKRNAYFIKIKTIILLTILICSNYGCKKFLEVGPPATSINEENVWSKENTAISVLTGIYAQLSQENSISTSDPQGLSTLSIMAGLNSDELVLFDQSDGILLPFYQNSLPGATTDYPITTFNRTYNIIYRVNVAYASIEKSEALSAEVKQQLLGECRFLRAFCYFYLVNLYGDVPKVTGIDAQVNNLLSRSPKQEIYSLIISDLQEATNRLNINFLGINLKSVVTERVRPSKGAAMALLSRAYLYAGKYAEAEQMSTNVISLSQFTLLQNLNEVFLKNSQETIWALQPVDNGGNGWGANSGDGRTFVLPPTGPNIGGYPAFPVYLSNDVVSNFEPGDNRKNLWVSSVTDGGITYNFPYKYKAGVDQTNVTEYSIVLRLGEQYLIRAEAKAKQNKLTEAIADLNILRSRARAAATVTIPNPLPPLSTLNLTQLSVYQNIENERFSELFTEWGHRWLDLKRTNGFVDGTQTRADEVMPAVMKARSGNWRPFTKLYPIPFGSLINGPNLKQNPGY